MSFTILCGDHANERRPINPNWIGDQQLGYILDEYLESANMSVSLLSPEQQQLLIVRTMREWLVFLSLFQGKVENTDVAYERLITASLL